MALGVRGSNPIWLEVDLQGNLFDDTFYLFVLENTIPYIPATVYHDPDLNVPWTNPIRFLGNGTLPVDIFFEQDKVYRLEFRQGPTQSDPLIYEVPDYIPNGSGLNPIEEDAFPTGNQITNPQFALVNFSSSINLTSATNPDPIEIAPGWFLELSGTGSVTISREALNSTNENSSNAPYALRFQLTGWDSSGIVLRQRFQQNGMLWANKTVSSTITARVGAAFQSISASLVPSVGTPTSILDVPTVNGSWVEYTGHGTMPETTNTDLPPAAYIDYRLALPNNSDIYITSIQLIVQDINNLTEPSFEQDSIERQIDHTFNYYKDPLEYKPIPSYLVAWDFRLNPCQALGITVAASAIGANKSRYIADQTIAFQGGDNVTSYAFSSSSGVTITTSSASENALIQYIPGNLAREILSQRCSIKIKGNVSGTTLQGTVSLWWTTDATLPNVNAGTNNSLVASVAAGVPTVGGGGVHGNWTQVVRANGLTSTPAFSLTTTSTEFDFNSFGEFNGAGSTSANFLAIVIAFGPLTAAQTCTFDYVSLVGGDIATRPGAQTTDEVVRQCQYYYEKSYSQSIIPGQADYSGCVVSQQLVDPPPSFGGLATTIDLTARYFELKFQQNKYGEASTIISLYSPATGTINRVSGRITNNAVIITESDIVAATNWTEQAIGGYGVNYAPANVNSLLTSGSVVRAWQEAVILFQFVADSRLGII